MRPNIYEIFILDKNINISFSLRDYGKIVCNNRPIVSGNEDENEIGFTIYNKEGEVSAIVPIGAFKKVLVFYEKPIQNILS